jgi:hypothetical protein
MSSASEPGAATITLFGFCVRIWKSIVVGCVFHRAVAVKLQSRFEFNYFFWVS